MPDSINSCGDCSAPAAISTSPRARSSRSTLPWRTLTPIARPPSMKIRIASASVKTCRFGRWRAGAR